MKKYSIEICGAVSRDQYVSSSKKVAQRAMTTPVQYTKSWKYRLRKGNYMVKNLEEIYLLLVK